MLYATFKALPFNERHTYLYGVFDRILKKEKRFALESIQYYNYDKPIPIRIQFVGLSKRHHVDIDAWHVDLTPFDNLWFCGPKSDCSIPIDMIQSILVNHKEVYSRG